MQWFMLLIWLQYTDFPLFTRNLEKERQLDLFSWCINSNSFWYVFVCFGGRVGAWCCLYPFGYFLNYWSKDFIFHNCCSMCIFNLFMYIYLLVLVKYTEKSYRSFYQYWTQYELDWNESLSILNKWIRMGLFFPLLVQIIRKKSQLAVFIRIHFQTLQFWYALRLSSAKVGSSTIYTT